MLINPYKLLLINPQDDIDALHDKFKVQYPHSAASKGSKTRDLPPVSGSIIWARQIDQQLTMYLKRVEDVLGEWLLVTCGYWWLLVVTSGY